MIDNHTKQSQDCLVMSYFCQNGKKYDKMRCGVNADPTVTQKDTDFEVLTKPIGIPLLVMN